MTEFLYRVLPARPAMLTEGPTHEERAAVAAHFAYLQELAAAGVVLLFGRTQTTGPETFGIVIFHAESADAAHRVMAGDPAVQAGVMRAEVFPFQIAGAAPGLSASA